MFSGHFPFHEYFITANICRHKMKKTHVQMWWHAWEKSRGVEGEAGPTVWPRWTTRKLESDWRQPARRLVFGEEDGQKKEKKKETKLTGDSCPSESTSKCVSFHYILADVAQSHIWRTETNRRCADEQSLRSDWRRARREERTHRVPHKRGKGARPARTNPGFNHTPSLIRQTFFSLS